MFTTLIGKKVMNKVIASLTFSLSLVMTSTLAQQAADLDQLLRQLEQGKIAQSEQNQTREAEFKSKVEKQFFLAPYIIITDF